MTEEIKPPIKILFAQLLKLIMGDCTSGEKVYEMITIVGSWCAVVFGTLVLMLEQRDQQRSEVVIDRITDALNRDAKKHLMMLRVIKNSTKEKRIIT